MKTRIINMKNILIVLSGIVFVLFVFYAIKSELNTCMGISFITEEEIQQRAYYQADLGNIVQLEGKMVPYDEVSNRIYLTCNVTENTKFHDLEGQLTSSLPGYNLYFLWDDNFNSLSDAIKYGYVFLMLALDSEGNFKVYTVSFTTLPVLEMHGEVIGIDDRERDIFSGELTVWDPAYEGTGRLVVQDSELEWHVRGYSSMSFQKKSLKLNLKEKNGNNNNLAILGFDADDDYILNPMWFDDIKVREKLAIDLWNEMADAQNSSLKMSDGEYCEIIINGEYQGLRLLQNKIEKSYLKLSENDTLLKGNNVNKGTKKPPEEVYEVIYSNQDEERTYQTISDWFYQTDFSNVDLDSWVDLQLFIHLGNMADNITYKNIYYVIQRDGDKESMRFVPWDTDMSFGIYWDDGFRYMPESVENISYRIEYEALAEQYPEVDAMLAERWQELRETIFTEENIFEKIDSYTARITDSGALARDYNYLGWNSWGGDDTLDNFKAYVQRRLQVLDELYLIDR